MTPVPPPFITHPPSDLSINHPIQFSISLPLSRYLAVPPISINPRRPSVDCDIYFAISTKRERREIRERAEPIPVAAFNQRVPLFLSTPTKSTILSVRR